MIDLLIEHSQKKIESVNRFFIFIGEMFSLFLEVIKCTFTRPFYFSRLMEQINQIGFGSTSITVVIGLTMGLV